MRTHRMMTTLFLAMIFVASPGVHVFAQSDAETATPQPPLGFIPSSFADLAEKLSPAVVNISTTQKITVPEDFPEIPQFPEGSPFQDFFDEFMDRRGLGAPMQPVTSLGSGFVIDAEKGYIITNNHVVRDAEEVRVTFADDKTVSAEIIGHDEKTDLAVLKVDTKDLKLIAVPFGNSDQIRVGDWIVAIGNPFGLGGTVTTGIVSARARDINSGPYDDYLQTDASINRGNSGGPMFNLKGEVIGINTAIFSPSGGSVGIGFAIPSSLAEPVIKQIIQYGRTKRGWIGVKIQSVTEEIAESLGLKGTHGALVASVTKGGPAEKVGLQAGDVITAFNSQKIDEMKMLPRFVASSGIDTEAKITYWRDGKEHETMIKVGELEQAEDDGLIGIDETKNAPEGKGVTVDSVGLVLQPISDEFRSKYGIDSDVAGVAVSGIKDLSEAAEKGMVAGDVIVEINQKPVASPQEVVEIIEKAQKAGRKSVLLLLNRGSDVRFVALRLKKDQ